jgi:hypothetical protein
MANHERAPRLERMQRALSEQSGGRRSAAYSAGSVGLSYKRP